MLSLSAYRKPSSGGCTWSPLVASAQCNGCSYRIQTVPHRCRHPTRCLCRPANPARSASALAVHAMVALWVTDGVVVAACLTRATSLFTFLYRQRHLTGGHCHADQYAHLIPVSAKECQSAKRWATLWDSGLGAGAPVTAKLSEVYSTRNPEGMKGPPKPISFLSAVCDRITCQVTAPPQRGKAGQRIHWSWGESVERISPLE
jgi:hypothetical protein